MVHTEKQEKLVTRKAKALRRTAVFLLVAALLQLTHLYEFFPASALWYAAEDVNCGRVRVIQRDWQVSGEGLGRLVYFGANDNALLMAKSQWNPLYGWMGMVKSAVDCSAPGPYHALVSLQASASAEEDRWQSVTAWAFGRVEDPVIQTIEVRFRVNTGARDGELLYEDRYVFSTSRESWMEKDGRDYFLLKMPDLSWSMEEVLSAQTIACDGAGNPVASCDEFYTDWTEM